MTQAAQFEQGGTSQGAGDDADDEGDVMEATSSAMEILCSSGMPPPRPSRTQGARASFSSSRDREHRGLWQELDHLTNEMGEMRIDQGATLNIVQQNIQLIQGIQEEEVHHWTAWWVQQGIYPPPRPPPGQ